MYSDSFTLEAGAVLDDFQVKRHARYVAMKTCVEWMIALGLLIVLSPLVLLLAILVKWTSEGPVFYSQTRLGLKGRRYQIYKLRTMKHNCEKHTGPVWASKNDSRITPIGRVLRSTHLDEVPQLWNILKGDMSLIGPRPERPEIAVHLEQKLQGYRGRLAVRPGVTGLAQMLLPPDSDLEDVSKKLAHDLYYIRNLTFVLDLRIAICTPFYFLRSAIEAVCSGLVSSYGADVDQHLAVLKEQGNRESAKTEFYAQASADVA